MSGANHGYVYRTRVGGADAGCSVLDFHVARFRHSDEAAWRASIDSGRVRVNGRRVAADARLSAGDELEFHRPPWNEPDAPASFDVAFEDEHVLVVVKPAGLQVLPAGLFSSRLWSLVFWFFPSRVRRRWFIVPARAGITNPSSSQNGSACAPKTI